MQKYKAGKTIKPFNSLCRRLHVSFLQSLLGQHSIDCAFDVGANIGQTHDFLREEVGFLGHVTSFEPNPEAFAVLAKRAKVARQWQALLVALGPEEGTGQFNVTADDKMSSFLTPHRVANGAGHRRKAMVEVNVHRLDRYVGNVTARKKDRKIFLKLDTQGFDIEALKGLSDELLDHVPIVQIELAVQPVFYAGAATMVEAIGYMGQRGYALATTVNTLSDPQYRAIEMDGIFIR